MEGGGGFQQLLRKSKLSSHLIAINVDEVRCLECTRMTQAEQTGNVSGQTPELPYPGGVTTLVVIPLNSTPPTTMVENLTIGRNAARGQYWMDVDF